MQKKFIYLKDHCFQSYSTEGKDMQIRKFITSFKYAYIYSICKKDSNIRSTKNVKISWGKNPILGQVS
jgi:hypothetical protein